MIDPLRPHFPDPDADPIQIMERALAEKDEDMSLLYAELRSTRAQLDDVLAKLAALESA